MTPTKKASPPPPPSPSQAHTITQCGLRFVTKWWSQKHATPEIYHYRLHTFHNMHNELSFGYFNNMQKSLYLPLILLLFYDQSRLSCFFFTVRSRLFYLTELKSLSQHWLLGLWFGYLLYTLWVITAPITKKLKKSVSCLPRQRWCDACWWQRALWYERSPSDQISFDSNHWVWKAEHWRTSYFKH